MTHLRPISALAALVLAAAGCASSTTEDGRLLNEEPNFTLGYSDGCVTSTEEDKSFSRTRERDDYLFKNDRAYRAGWRQGYLQCGGRDAAPSDGGLILGQENEY